VPVSVPVSAAGVRLSVSAHTGRVMAKRAKQRDNGNMKKLGLGWVALITALLLPSGCAALFPERTAEQQRELDEANQRKVMKQERFRRCLREMPVLHLEPLNQNRVIRVVEAADENDLVRAACEERADAVISTFSEDRVTSTTVGGGRFFAAGHSRTTSEVKFIGRAIKYVRRAPISRPLPTYQPTQPKQIEGSVGESDPFQE
jgi:hypothetical protein